jgi:uncharacterized protein (DUF1501 family)
MMTISRRVFVKAGALGLVSLGAEAPFIDRAVYALQRSGRLQGKTLVLLFQRGAVDGLSMLVPVADPWYWRERSRIAIPREQLLPLTDEFALHPRLAPFKALWDRGQLAVIPAAGSPALTRSHFDAQDYMESGTPDRKSTTDGWANRLLTHHDAEHRDTPFRAVAFGPQLPRTLAGSAPSLAIDDLRTFGVREARRDGDARLTRAFEALYQGSATGLVASSSAEGFEAIRMLRHVNPAAQPIEHNASYPRGRFGQSLQQIAQLIKADLGLEVAFADIGGWDTHVNQGSGDGQLATRLDEFAGAIGAFVTDLGPRMRDVVVLTMSEFGRTVKENGTGGTDHGHATTMFVLGGAVRGGMVHGHWPGLSPEQRHEGRDLALTTDYRDLFSEVVTGHLGSIDLDGVFPGHATGPKLGLFG